MCISSCSRTICWRDFPSLHWIAMNLYLKSIDYICMNLLLNTILVWTLHCLDNFIIKVEVRLVNSSNCVLLFQDCLAIPYLSHFHKNFRIILLISTWKKRNADGIYITCYLSFSNKINHKKKNEDKFYVHLNLGKTSFN